MIQFPLTYGFNANAEAEASDWVKGKSDRKEGNKTKPERNSDKSNLDYADDVYYAGLKYKKRIIY